MDGAPSGAPPNGGSMDKDIRPDYIGLAMDRIGKMLSCKGADYSNGSDDPFVNFKETGAMMHMPPRAVALVQCGIKMSRIRHLEMSDSVAVNESIDDSYLDLACYAVLALAMLGEEEFNHER